jgi:hypothetical protein
MAKVSAIANLIEFNDRGETTRKPVRLSLTLNAGMKPQNFTVDLPGKRSTRFQSIQITRAEIERVLNANPKPRPR